MFPLKVFISKNNPEEDWRKESKTGRKDCFGEGSILESKINVKLYKSEIINFFHSVFGSFPSSDNILNEKIYDARIRPASMNSSDGPTNIKVNLMLRSIDKIDDVKMEFSTQITFRQQWFDNRLMFDDMDGKIKYLTMTESDKVRLSISLKN